MVLGSPQYRGQEDGSYGSTAPYGERGQIVPYGVNGAPPETEPTTIATFIAGEALGGHRGAYVAADGEAYHANPNSTARFCIGVTTGAVSLGADAAIQINGEMEEASWTWTASEVVWLGAGGVLTQTVPTTGVAFQVGVPMGPTKLRIEPEHVAILS